jgi:hypothetical protein
MINNYGLRLKAPPKPKPQLKEKEKLSDFVHVSDSFLARPSRGLGSAGLPVQPKYKTKLTYCQNVVTTTGGAGGVFNAQFACNSVYDPYVTAGGHQPMGLDQLLGTFYQFCRVYACDVYVDAQAGSGGSGNQAVFGIQFSENSSYSPSDLSVIVERGNCVWRTLPIRAANHGGVRVHKRWDGRKWWPSPTQVQDQSNNNTISAGPTGELAYANVFACQAGAGTYDDFYLTVTIIYEVEFFGQLQTTPS